MYLFDVANLEPSFWLDAHKCTAEGKSTIILIVNSTTTLTEQLQSLSCKRSI